jgi:cyclopropane fatty-acyl-phospholipid synthase-like methyltransferase
MENVSIWDKWNKLGGPKYPHNKVVQFLFRLYKTPEERSKVKVLDLGCGSGVNTVFLAMEQFQTYGLDISPVAIENTRRKLESMKLKYGWLKVGSLDRIDCESGFFDVVISIGVIDSAGKEALDVCLPEISRVLTKGGKALLIFASDLDVRKTTCADLNIHCYSDAEVAESLKKISGLYQTIYRDRYITTYQNNSYRHDEHLITLIK